MSRAVSALKYAASHEWARLEDDGTVTVGISERAQRALGDVVFVDLPELGAALVAGGEAGVVESVKAASDIYAPLGGEVLAVNTALADAPETVNADPCGAGWLFKLRPGDVAELERLLTAGEYDAQCAEPKPGDAAD